MYNWKEKSDEQIAKLVISNHARLVKRREVYADLWRLIVQIFRPRRYSLLGEYQRGKQFGANIFDQGPANALSRFVAGKIGYMVNRSVPWIQFITPDARLMGMDHIKGYCQDAAEQVLYAIGRSSLYTALVPHTLDSDSVGTSIMVPQEDELEGRLHFDVVDPAHSYIGIGQFGKPKVYHRELQLTRMTAEEIFGQDALPTDWYREDKQTGTKELKEVFQEDAYLWAMYPNDDRDTDSFLSEDMRYLVLCVLQGSTKPKQSKLVYKKGRNHFVICTRPGRDSGADYGTSIAAECLTAALVVNKLGEKGIEAAHKIVDPAVIASKSLRPTLQTNAGSRTWVDDIQREGVKTWMDKINWPITDAQMERLHAQIDNRMFIKFFEMLSTGDLTERTAYEVSQMMGEKATLMTTLVDTYEQESLEPSIGVIIESETLAGRMPDVPEEILYAGGRLDITYLGPLAQLQRSLLRSKGTIDALSLIERIVGMNEQAGWKIDWLELIEEVTVANGMPQRLIRSDEEVAAIAQNVEQAEQAEQQRAQLETAAGAAQKLGKRIEPRSVLSQVMGPQREAIG